ncbi:hypothetical protein B0T25DRAFT_607756 [Lasiosphaeria hispida]|uniref:Uncharacterized protein n=1 Tax=Lasiosphaeria hispida TaxID=260671 RepID=A0AAJ0HIP9_9PEZI|nr:hypothetical protein B0T25DRAFT_607756 [Lasiosphaeria hispida]
MNQNPSYSMTERPVDVVNYLSIIDSGDERLNHSSSIPISLARTLLEVDINEVRDLTRFAELWPAATIKNHPVFRDWKNSARPRGFCVVGGPLVSPTSEVSTLSHLCHEVDREINNNQSKQSFAITFFCKFRPDSRNMFIGLLGMLQSLTAQVLLRSGAEVWLSQDEEQGLQPDEDEDGEDKGGQAPSREKILLAMYVFREALAAALDAGTDTITCLVDWYTDYTCGPGLGDNMSAMPEILERFGQMLGGVGEGSRLDGLNFKLLFTSPGTQEFDRKLCERCGFDVLELDEEWR